ncbi:hypothetical protein BV22DRAFT_1031156 [Leucogyrophana mollusca]|uniref:Uncharacterized protein n=1 Tax=Leucogyrophana mollusca TaxID=85980 RepID=A0ACB8BQ11_9AGAM|nr:hypothetical protein BV22DRAFT_1031156 [Leucogyrophana mollusca]
MASTSVPDPVTVLTSELQNKLKGRIDNVLARIVKTNLHTRFTQESAVFTDFHSAVGVLGDGREAQDSSLLEAFRATVPLTTYPSYEPFIARFFEQPCKEDRVKDLFAPGLPLIVALSSATSGGASKFFAKYRHMPVYDWCPIPMSESGGTTCAVLSLKTFQLIEIHGDGETTFLPVAPVSSTAIRMRNDINEGDHTSTLKRTLPGMSSPLAVSYLGNYRSFLLMHALFALADPALEFMYMCFSTTFVDMIRYVEEQWETLINSIETGELPNYEDVDAVREYLTPKFPPQPSRAAELRAIGISTDTPGWLARVWPRLKTVVSIASGMFGAAVPKMQHYLGPNVLIRTLGLTASEGFVGLEYNPSDLNLFKAASDSVIEYLDVSADVSHANLVPAWEIQTGHQYEVVMTTRDGLWRYRLEDVIEVAGFDPEDGVPVLKYVDRRNVLARLGGTMTSGKVLTDAILATQDALGKIAEFTVVMDHRTMPSRFGYIVEIEGALGPDVHAARQKVTEHLRLTGLVLQKFIDGGIIGQPSIRILKPGTFAEFRQRKVELANSGAGQMKVPVVLSDEPAQKWLFERVMEEL